MFQDLDSTLTKILDDPAMNAAPLAPPLTELLGADISFITPDKNFETALGNPTVNLFLYDVKENRELRDTTPIIEKIGTTFVRREAPVRIDCSYIVTAWSKLPNQQKVAEEHRLLAQALLWLTRFPVIPPVYLQGRLTTQIYPLLMWVAQVDPNKNAGEFWDALAIPPRPAFYLTVTIAMDLGLQDSGPLVTTKSANVQSGFEGAAESQVQIGGSILTAAHKGIPDALVDILDLGLRVNTDSDGRYVFPRVLVGTRTVRVVAVGFKSKTQVLTIPSLPENYNITLDPL
jgi:hypothetical protein